MSICKVNLLNDVFMICLSHALSTEKEEVMGLLIGEVDERNICTIVSVVMLRRSDKRKDRVEISPEQLSAASTEAEEIGRVLCKPVRIVGWYHSHPHITVWPSQLDVQTQSSYQLMDSGFVGIIFSVFNEEDKNNYKVLVTCFQSKCDENDPKAFVRVEVPIEFIKNPVINYPNLNSLAKLPKILYQEEQSLFSTTAHVADIDLVTRLHNYSVYSKALCNIVEVIGGPLLQILETRLSTNEKKKRKLEEQRLKLEEELQELQNRISALSDDNEEL